MRDADAKVTRLADYEPPTHSIETTHLRFEITEDGTQVRSRLAVSRQRDHDASSLRLDGELLELESVSIDGRLLAGNEYQLDAESLTLLDVPERCEIEIVTRIYPDRNTALQGLYRSGGMYCTQCEAEGFRNITYYLDRPDVMSRYTTTIVADAEHYPVLLSNGNLVSEQAIEGGRIEATWHDPFPKPSYLFALVAGDLASISDEFVTGSGRRVELRIYSEPHNIGKCGYAMDVLKRAMRWDEEAFGREYDLDIFMVVAVEHFNMGAMENKGLNIFNTSCVLATPDTATDSAYQFVEAVVAHEYFHNWSGNRVTCRDWFQLSLKEGFTVYRDAEFSSDMNSRSVKRIEDVEALRTEQFAEDAGAMAHPVRPDSYMEISNFYTPTVYEKGAEVVGMLATLLGRAGFRAGCDLYFARHDGQAVTTEDFVRAMEDANGVDLAQFRRWYTQAGTPVIDVAIRHAGEELELHFAQSCPPTPGQPAKEPFHIPMALGLLADDGREMLGGAGRANGFDLAIDADPPAVLDNPNGDGTLILSLTQPRTRVRIRGIRTRPAVSLLRGFSAPGRLRIEREDHELAFLARHDTDGFSRWDAMRSLQCAALRPSTEPQPVPAVLAGLYQGLVGAAGDVPDDGEAKAMLAEMLALPSEAYLYEQSTEIDVEGIHRARVGLKSALGKDLYPGWLSIHEGNRSAGPYRADGVQIAQRKLKNVALSYLVAGAGADSVRQAQLQQLLTHQLEHADNLTDRVAALVEIVNLEAFPEERRAALLTAFYERWADESLVVNRWFSIQAAASLPGALDRIARLERHPVFERRNPNRVRALYGAFATQNLINFHARDGSGYRFLAHRVADLDAINPQIAARLLTPLTRWHRFDERRRELMKGALREVAARESLSPDVNELVTKGLQ
jgi:aminopeptidase N